MAGSARHTREWLRDPVLLAIMGLGGLIALSFALALSGRFSEPRGVLPWFVPAADTFLVLVTASVAMLAVGRWKAGNEAAYFWTVVGFSGFAIGILFHFLTFPGVWAPGRALVGRYSQAPAWAILVGHAALAVALLLAAVARWPGGARAGSRAAPLAPWVAALLGLQVLLLVYGGRLPDLINPDGSFDSLVSVVYVGIGIACSVGGALSFRRYRRTRDVFSAYVVMCQLTLLYLAATNLCCRVTRFGPLWYSQFLYWIVGFVAMLIGFLSEYLQLYRREQTTTAELRVALTLRERAEQERETTLTALREADRRKDEFLGVLSHELRNPLAPIRNSLYILAHADPTGPQALRAREVMTRQVSHLTRLVDDLLDVTRIARGKIQLKRAELDVGRVTRQAAEDHRMLMEEAGIGLEIVTADEPLVVNADEARVTQILGNLLHNARKFTPAGGRVVVSASRQGNHAAIRVRDTGVGVDPELVPYIFEPFSQAKQALARSPGGLGLGLALVKALVDLHDGDVALASFVPGGGSEFIVELPLAQRDDRSTHPGARGPARDPAARSRVLVVDDSVDAAESLADLVRVLGYEVEVAYEARTAIDKVSKIRPDVVLCDIGMPGMNGYELARVLRTILDPRARLVAVTGYAQPSDVQQAVEAGFDAHVQKPPDPARIEQLLH